MSYLRDNRSPRGRDEGPNRARLSYAKRGSIPAERPVNAVPLIIAGLGDKIGPAAPGWRAQARSSWRARHSATTQKEAA